MRRERKDENGTERRNNKGEREEDRIELCDCIDPIIVRRLSPIRLKGKRKKKEGNIRQLREFEFRLLAKVKKLASNTDIGSFHHPRGIDRRGKNGRLPRNSFEGDVKIEIFLNASTGWNANYALIGSRGSDREISFCNI